jgi:uncharacterized protein (UPF0335 family)
MEYQAKSGNLDANQQNEWNSIMQALRTVGFDEKEITDFIYYMRADNLSNARQTAFDALKAKALSASYTKYVYVEETRDLSTGEFTASYLATETVSGNQVITNLNNLSKLAGKSYEMVKSDYDYLQGAWKANKTLIAQFEAVIERIQTVYEEKKKELDALKIGGIETAKQNFANLQEIMSRDYFIIVEMAKILNSPTNNGYQISGQIGQIQTPYRVTNIDGSTPDKNLFRTISIVANKATDTSNSVVKMGEDSEGEIYSLLNFEAVVFDSVTEIGGGLVTQDNGLSYRVFGIIRKYQNQNVIWEYQGSYGPQESLELYTSEMKDLKGALSTLKKDLNILNHLADYDNFKNAFENYN